MYSKLHGGRESTVCVPIRTPITRNAVASAEYLIDSKFEKNINTSQTTVHPLICKCLLPVLIRRSHFPSIHQVHSILLSIYTPKEDHFRPLCAKKKLNNGIIPFWTKSTHWNRLTSNKHGTESSSSIEPGLCRMSFVVVTIGI